MTGTASIHDGTIGPLHLYRDDRAVCGRARTAFSLMALRIFAAAALLLFAAGCTTVPPERTAEFPASFVPNGSELFAGQAPAPLKMGDAHLLGITMPAEDTVYLYYAPQTAIDRDSARVESFSEIYRVDLSTGTRARIAQERAEELAGRFPRFERFRDFVPEDEVLFGGSVVLPLSRLERRISFTLDSEEQRGEGHRADIEVGTSKRLRVTLYVRFELDNEARQRRLRIAFERPDGTRVYRLDPDLVRLSNGLNARLLRLMTAMRFDGERYVSFANSLFDLETGDRHRLIENVPRAFVDTIAVGPEWEAFAAITGSLRFSRSIGSAELALPHAE